ncbi:auxin-induced protein 15A-like [Tripterygium wilfordii]|uniref:auxin-induced protein 15A-like n=1 Tax=Tripterygium wilfordii TaxID=458696 RepID=UPI0018F82574|nr:auxin-induced protein 15A-like [Tripterygium wilfordii]
MGFRLPSVIAKQILRWSYTSIDVPKGFLAIYVGSETQKKRFVVPVSYLKQPSFLDFLSKAEEEFGYNHSMGGLTIPCTEGTFIDVISSLGTS